MSGFPNRPARVAFGPQMQNVRAPVIPEKDLSANQMNLTFWQLAGAGRTLPMAVLLFDGAAPAILYQTLAFDPRQELGELAFAKAGTGDYTFTFASTYKDQRGSDTPYSPIIGMAMVQNGAPGTKAQAFVPVAQAIKVEVRDIAEALVDGTFLLAVW